MQIAGGWNVILREESTTLSPDPGGAVVCAFDREGRPVAWSEEGSLYKRTLASEVHGRRVDEEGRHRWRVSRDEAILLFRRLLDRVGEVPAEELDDAGRTRLEEIRRWTPDKLLDERRRFDAAYRPLGILPPDQYLAVVLQATFGCSWNRCTFCSFYKNRDFGVRTTEEFRAHLEAVGALFGRGALLRKRIFLADGDALVLSNARLVPLLEMARQAFPDRPVSGFVDVFAGLNKAPGEWAELRRLGLDRVQVGIETGDDRLLKWLDKPGTAGEARVLVEALKAAGLKVSVIFLIGVGGDRFAADHVARSLALVEALPLETGDIVYLSPLMELSGSAYSRRAKEEGVQPLDDEVAADQLRLLREGVRRAHPRVKVALYDIREFTY
jgi:radical SAM superfamily enzyme YgiQ (UPF0313 family)